VSNVDEHNGGSWGNFGVFLGYWGEHNEGSKNQKFIKSGEIYLSKLFSSYKSSLSLVTIRLLTY